MTIRVVRVISRLNVGGPAIHATLLTRQLTQEGFATVLVAGAESAGEGSYLELHGSEVEHLTIVPSLGREVSLLNDLVAYRALVKVIRQQAPKIVHTHTAKAGVVGRLAAWRCGVPVIIHTFHGHVFHGYFPPWKTAIFVFLERLLARLSTRLLAVSAQVRDEVLARGVGRPDQFEVLKLGLDLDRFTVSEVRRGELRRELGLSSTVPLVGIVARLVPIKAHEVFIAMAAEVARRKPEAVFLIVGDGERRQDLERIVATVLPSQVRFLGWRADLDRIYADLDVVVLTSRNEGSPVALIEAMASARPVVSTAAGGVRDLVGDAGVVRDIDDAAGLAEAVIELLDSPSRAAALGARGRERVVPAYSERRLVADMATLYKRLLSPGAG